MTSTKLIFRPVHKFFLGILSNEIIEPACPQMKESKQKFCDMRQLEEYGSIQHKPGDPLTLNNLKNALFLLIFGHFVGLVVLLTECCFSRFKEIYHFFFQRQKSYEASFVLICNNNMN